MGFIRDDIYQMILKSEQLADDERLSIFEYLSQKFSVIPLQGGFASPIDAAGDPDELKRMAKKLKRPIESGWNKWCENKRPFERKDFSADRAGIACGPASDVLVLDVDDMGRFWEVLEFNGIEQTLPPTFAVKTGGRGDRYHYYFKYPTDGKKYSNRSKSGCFDVRGVGGQVICPGSLHPETIKPYLVATNEDILDAPEWLLEYSSRSREIFTKEEPESTSRKSFPNTTRADTSDIELSEIISGEMDFFIANLPVSDDVKQKIMTQYTHGSRSEASWSVLLGLLNAKVDERSIRRIYDHYPIGDKSRQKPEWFEQEVERAKNLIAQNPIGVDMQLGFQSGSNDSSSDSGYSFITGLDVLNSPQNFEFIIDNFWPKNEPLLITGPGGSGKSVMTLQIAMDLVFPPQKGLLDRFQVMSSEHKVMFVQSENSLVGLKRRMEIIAKSYPIPPDVIRDKLLFFGKKGDVRSSGDINGDKLKHPLERIHGQTNFDILILDPLISFHDQDENSNDAMRRFLDKFFDFCDKLKVTPLMIHHHGKFRSEKGIGGGRGASAIGDWSANTWELEFVEERKDKDGNVTQVAHHLFTQKKARSYESNAKMMLQMKDLRFYPIVFATSTSAAAKQDVKISFVVEALKSMGGTTANQKLLIQAVMDLCQKNKLPKVPAKATIISWINSAVANGHVKVQDGVGGVKGYSF
uniref:RecA-family ATPase n=1 Tax=Desulfovibrio sp. U5L TaxID=596152 RepID=I2Q6K5_9BACT